MATTNESSSCCPAGSWGKLLTSSSYEPKGSILLLDNDLKAYYVSPDSTSSKAIILFPDVYGFSDRFKSICDNFSKQGYHAIMPDSFRGDTAENKPDLIAWITTFAFDTVVKPDINACIDFLASKNVDRSAIGSIGFCWGVWAIAKASSTGVSLKCGVGCHPSTKLEEIGFGGDENAMLKSVNMPLLLLPAGNDPENVKPGSEVVSYLESKGGGSVVYENMVHGFVSRGDTDVDIVKKDAEDALERASQFFKKHL